VKLPRPNSFIPTLVGWLIVFEGLANILMAVLPQFNLHLDRVLIEYFIYVRFFEIQQLANVLAIFMGVAFILLGRGLAKKQYSSWRIAIIFLLITIVSSVFPSVFLPTLIYTLIMLLILIIFQKSFFIKTPNPLRTEQWLALASIAFVLTYATIGSYLLRDQYHNLNDWVDAIYYALVTYTTIGYGDIVPITQNAKVFTCSVIIIGVSTFVAATGLVLGPIIEKRLKGVFTMVSRLNIKSHVIIFGVNPMSLHTGKLLQTKGEVTVFLSSDPQALSEAENQGFKIILGSASKEDVLNKAQLTEAHALVCASQSDAENLLVLMAAQSLRAKTNAKFRIIVRIDEPEHIEFAKNAGADEVISPSMLMGDSITKEFK
jgi:voltage-gated potassium channel